MSEKLYLKKKWGPILVTPLKTFLANSKISWTLSSKQHTAKVNLKNPVTFWHIDSDFIGKKKCVWKTIQSEVVSKAEKINKNKKWSS